MPKRPAPLQIIDDFADIPPFRDEREEAAFWGTHRLSDALLDQMQPLGADVAPLARATTSITVRIDQALLARLQALARQRQMPYQRLLKQFIQERLQQEEAATLQGAGHEDRSAATGQANPEAVRQTARSIAKLAQDLDAAVANLIRQ